MKSLLLFLCFALGFAGVPAFANNSNLICEEDTRPADGSYAKLEVKFLAGDRANVYLSHMSGGFAPPAAGSNNFTNQLIGNNLICRWSRSLAVTLDCYSENSRLPVIRVMLKRVYDTEFVEVLKDSKSIALFDSSSCKTKF